MLGKILCKNLHCAMTPASLGFAKSMLCILKLNIARTIFSNGYVPPISPVNHFKAEAICNSEHASSSETTEIQISSVDVVDETLKVRPFSYHTKCLRQVENDNCKSIDAVAPNVTSPIKNSLAYAANLPTSLDLKRIIELKKTSFITTGQMSKMASAGFACSFRQPLHSICRTPMLEYPKFIGIKTPLSLCKAYRYSSASACKCRRKQESPLLHAAACSRLLPLALHRSFTATSVQLYNPRYKNNNNNHYDSGRYSDSSRPRRSYEPYIQRNRYEKNNGANYAPRPRSIMNDILEEENAPARTFSRNKDDLRDTNFQPRSFSSDRVDFAKSELDETAAADADDDAADAEAEQQLDDVAEKNDDDNDSAQVEFLEFPEFSPEQNKEFRIVQFEYHVLLQAGHMVPEVMLEKHWRDVLRQPSRAGRLRYYRYLFKTEKSQQNALVKKKLFSENYRVDRDRRLVEAAEREQLGLLTYGLNFNSIFFRIRETTMNRHKHWRLCFARMLDDPLIIDVGYEQHMRDQELKSLVLQIRDAHAYNCNSIEPFYFQLVNVNRSGRFYEMLRLALPTIDTGDFIAELDDRHYTDLFPADQICILTRDSPNVLTSYDPNKKYVIGGLVDRRYPQPYTYAKAKRERITTARLPIDELLIWKQGDKNLTINQIVGIMVDIKSRDCSMEDALKRHIPTRKYMTDRDLREAKEQNIPITELKARFSGPNPKSAAAKKQRNYSMIDELLTM